MAEGRVEESRDMARGPWDKVEETYQEDVAESAGCIVLWLLKLSVQSVDF